MRGTLPLIRNPNSAIVLLSADVYAASVFAHHSVAVEGGRERLDGVARHGDPARGQSPLVAFVEGRDDISFEDAVERFGVASVGLFGRLAYGIFADGPAVATVVAFEPPAVQDRQVESAVQSNLLAARSRRFERSARDVHPNVNRLH